MGSVKDLEIIKKPDKDEHGIGRFHFSDRYSVFDYGEMPDIIENKGKALCMLSAYFFEILEKKLNMRVEPGYKHEIPVPFACPKCNAVQYSNAQYCWKCGVDLTKFYNKKAG